MRLLIVAGALGLLTVLALGTELPTASSKPRPAKPKPLCLGKRATVVGTAKSNQITGTRRADVIVSLGGSDAVSGGAGNDLICAGPGADTLLGGAGSDRLDGGAGFDTCRGGERLRGCEETRPVARKGALAADEYLGDPFRPKVSFRVGTGWSLLFDITPTQFILAQRRDPGGLSITFDSFASAQSVSAVLARIAGSAGIRPEPTVSATVGGATGQRFEALVTASEIILVPGLADRYELEPNDRARFYAIDVRGVTVTIIIEAPAQDWDAFLSLAEQVLASVSWDN